MIKIRNGLNGPIEFSVKSGNIKIMRSKIQGKPEFLTEITKKQYDELIADEGGKISTFKALIKNGDLQVIRDVADSDEPEVDRAFSREDLEAHAAEELTAYKEGEGKELIQSSLKEAEGILVEEFEEILKTGKSQAVSDAKIVWADEAKTKLDEAVRDAVTTANNVLIKKHNKEKSKGNVTNW